MKIITGGVTAAKGFQAASTAAGIKYQGRTDMAMVYSEKPCVAAGTFTTNIVKAAPVNGTRRSYINIRQHRWSSATVALPTRAQEKKASATAGQLPKQQQRH